MNPVDGTIKAKEGETVTPTKTSDLDVNAHKKDHTFEDKDHDIIEDLSVDPTLEAHEKAEQADVHGEDLKPVGGSIFDNMFEIDDTKPDDYDVEETTPDGRHYKKHVHKGPGYQQISIESDEPMNIGEIMGKLMSQASKGNPVASSGGARLGGGIV